MSLLKQIDEDLKKALKSKKVLESEVLRMLKTAIRNKEIEKKRKELTEEEILAVVRKEIKTRQDSITQFKKGNRGDLAEKEQAEADLLRKYLPPELSKEKIVEKAQAVMRQMQSASGKDFGKVMGVLMKELKGQAEGKIVKEIVQELLTKNN